MTKTAYFASPLFSEMEQQFNERLVAAIRDAYSSLDPLSMSADPLPGSDGEAGCGLRWPQ